jgi:phosphoglucosamine mutase
LLTGFVSRESKGAMVSRKYFGTDGVRGRVGEIPITPDFVMRLGHAAGRVLAAHDVERSHVKAGERPAVLIGKDTRISGYMLEAALEAGFSAAGVDVCLVGPMPTPAIAYLTRALRLQAGIVISASHNPYYDNGIKFFSARGTKLPDDLEAEIEAALDESLACVPSAGLGRARRIDDADGRYIEFCKGTFPFDMDLRGLKIVVDCANGAAYHLAPHVFHELGAEVTSLGTDPNGLNINQDVGATAPAALREAVLAQGADLGIALDATGPQAQLQRGAVQQRNNRAAHGAAGDEDRRGEPCAKLRLPRAQTVLVAVRRCRRGGASMPLGRARRGGGAHDLRLGFAVLLGAFHARYRSTERAG